MSPGKLNSRILADRVAWINRMLEEVGKLPLDDYECFILDSRNIWTAESCMPDTTATYEKGKLYEFVRFTDQRDPAGELPSPGDPGQVPGGPKYLPGVPHRDRPEEAGPGDADGLITPPPGPRMRRTPSTRPC